MQTLFNRDRDKDAPDLLLPDDYKVERTATSVTVTVPTFTVHQANVTVREIRKYTFNLNDDGTPKRTAYAYKRSEYEFGDGRANGTTSWGGIILCGEAFLRLLLRGGRP